MYFDMILFTGVNVRKDESIDSYAIIEASLAMLDILPLDNFMRVSMNIMCLNVN